MTNNNGLLPCPFCGGYARPMRCQIGIEGTMGCNKWVTITCSMCEINNGGKGGFMRPRYDTEEEAAKAWNTRANEPDTVSAEDLKTKIMDYYLDCLKVQNIEYGDGVCNAIDHLRKQHPNGIKWGE